jgi:hypothetical protein
VVPDRRGEDLARAISLAACTDWMSATATRNWRAIRREARTQTDKTSRSKASAAKVCIVKVWDANSAEAIVMSKVMRR